jgi:CMP/dCMP kinase
LRHIAISGELGSGKSTLAALLSAELDMPVVRSGDALRGIAREMGISTLDANLLAEAESMIDDQIDGALIEIAASHKAAILDSRMAWHFVPTAIKIHLIVEPVIAARRLSTGRTSVVENYQSADQAYVDAEARHQSEVRRFREKYDVDISRLENYDLVVDSSDASPQQVFDTVASFIANPQPHDFPLRLSPTRIVPAAIYHARIESSPSECLHEHSIEDDDTEHISIVYVRPHIFAVAGFKRLTLALADGDRLVPAALAAEHSLAPAVRQRSSRRMNDYERRVCEHCLSYWRATYGVDLVVHPAITWSTNLDNQPPN